MGTAKQQPEAEVEYFDVDTCFGKRESPEEKQREDSDRWKAKWESILSMHRNNRKSIIIQ